MNAEALAAFGGKFREDELARLGERIGIDLSWAKLGENSELRKLSEKGGKDAVGKWAEKLFCEVRDARNVHAHRGAGETQFDWDEVHKYLNYLECLANAIEERVRRDLTA